MSGKLFSLDHMAVGCVVIAGIVEAAQQALTSAPKVASVLPSATASPSLNYLPLGLITVAGFLWVLHQTTGRDAKEKSAGATVSIANPISLKPITGRIFEQERVVLDGNAYIGCTFNRVTFVFNGGACSVTRCSVNGRPRLETSNVQLLNQMALLHRLQFLAPEVEFADAVRQ